MLKEKIKTLIDIIQDTEINELEISSFWGAQKIRLKKKNDSVVETQVVSSVTETPKIQETPFKIEHGVLPTPVQNVVKETKEVENAETQKTGTEIIAPLVGTYYASSKPGSPAFVKVGDKIEIGQVICIVEAMKIFNEIEAEISGEILEIIATDGSPVEYGQPLMIIKE